MKRFLLFAISDGVDHLKGRENGLSKSFRSHNTGSWQGREFIDVLHSNPFFIRLDHRQEVLLTVAHPDDRGTSSGAKRRQLDCLRQMFFKHEPEGFFFFQLLDSRRDGSTQLLVMDLGDEVVDERHSYMTGSDFGLWDDNGQKGIPGTYWAVTVVGYPFSMVCRIIARESKRASLVAPPGRYRQRLSE